MPFHVDVLSDESLRGEFERLLPYRRISSNRPYVDENYGAFRNVVAGDVYVFSGESRHQHRRHRMHSHRLFDDRFYVWEIRNVFFGHPPLLSDHPVEFFRRLFENIRLSQELRDRPLHRHGGALRSSGYQILTTNKNIHVK